MEPKFLKLRNFILIIITGLIFTACSKDSTPEEDLIGTWTVESATFTAMIGSKTLTQYFIDEMGLTAVEAQQFTAIFNAMMEQTFTGTIQFKSDNTYTSNLGGDADNGTWSLTVDGKTLTIDSSTDDPITLDIIELTSEKCKLEMLQSISEDLNDDGTPETITVTINATFTK